MASDFFDSAIEQIEWFREKDRSREPKLKYGEMQKPIMEQGKIIYDQM